MQLNYTIRLNIFCVFYNILVGAEVQTRFIDQVLTKGFRKCSPIVQGYLVQTVSIETAMRDGNMQVVWKPS